MPAKSFNYPEKPEDRPDALFLWISPMDIKRNDIIRQEANEVTEGNLLIERPREVYHVPTRQGLYMGRWGALRRLDVDGVWKFVAYLDDADIKDLLPLRRLEFRDQIVSEIQRRVIDALEPFGDLDTVEALEVELGDYSGTTRRSKLVDLFEDLGGNGR